MKRRLYKLVVFLILGAIVNVSVAWGCVGVHGDVESDWSPYHNPYEDPLVFHVTSRVGYKQVRGDRRSGTLLARHGDEVRRYRRGVWWPPQAVSAHVTSYGIAAGWPSLALSTCRTTKFHAINEEDWRDWTPVLSWGVLWDHNAFEREDSRTTLAPRIFPLRPIWPGFAINTVFYASYIWMLTLCPRTARRMIRRKRSLCIKCGYDLRGAEHEVCPECGARPMRRSASSKPSPSGRGELTTGDGIAGFTL